MQPLIVLLAVVVPPLLVEALRSRHNERQLRARGAIEPAGDVYRAMQVAYPGMFVAMAIEGLLRGPAPVAGFVSGLVVFLAAKAIKWAAIVSLADRWTFHVLVLPGAPLVTGGPYRFMRHPNYVGVLGEIVGAALMMGAPVTGVLSLVGFGLLLRRRIDVEERALRIRN
jgi:methyltransferase